jgi:hypothetical protein
MDRLPRLALITFLLLTGCARGASSAGSPASGVPPTSGTSPTGGAGPAAPTGVPAPSCPAANTYSPGPAGFEVEGAGDGSLWALLFLTNTNSTMPARREVKIVFRMTGSGDLSIRAVGPTGEQLGPQWGPEGHGGSNWQRPGDEWGTGWVFPTAGCWTIQASRTGGGAAALTLRAA